MSREVNITPCFKVIKSVLLFKEYETREDVLKVAQQMAQEQQPAQEVKPENAKV